MHLTVDTHAHVMSDKAPLVAERHSAPHRTVTVEEFIGVLDAYGVDCGVLTQPSFYGTDNSILLDALAAYPDRLRGTAIVAPGAPESHLADLHGKGIRGIRLNWFHRDALPDIHQYASVFGIARELGIHVEVYIEGAKLPALLPTIRQSGVTLVLDHFGSPDPVRGVECEGFQAALSMVREGRAFVKLSAPYRLGGAPAQPYVDALMEAGGPQRLMWGSDWPWVSNDVGRDYAQLQSQFVEWVPDAADRAVILGATPAGIFGFSAAAVSSQRAEPSRTAI